MADEYLLKYLTDVLSNLQLAPIATTAEVVKAYIGPKRKIYERAEVSLYDSGLKAKHARLNSFVKFEKQDLSKAPRCINPRSPEYNLLLGKYLKFNEKKYFAAIAGVFRQEHVVIKGMDVEESAGLIVDMVESTPGAVIVGGDASKFDMHVSLESLEYEHMFYLLPHHGGSVEECLHDYRLVQALNAEECPAEEGFPELSWLLSKQLNNEGTAYFDDGKLSFKMRGTRASGDLNTSLGNCVIMSALNKSWADRARTEVKLANNGDDCATILRREQLQQWLDGQVDYYASKGFRMALEPPVYHTEGLEFCQSKPVCVDGTWRMVRNPSTLITKASMCLKPCRNLKDLRRWMMAVGLCEGKLSDGVPVLAAFARCMRRNGLRCSSRQLKLVEGESSRAREGGMDSPITLSSRISFWAAWGIPPREQELLEEHYNGWVLGDNFGPTLSGEEACEKALEVKASVVDLLSPNN